MYYLLHFNMGAKECCILTIDENVDDLQLQESTPLEFLIHDDDYIESCSNKMYFK
jgi:hypothetical protein